MRRWRVLLIVVVATTALLVVPPLRSWCNASGVASTVTLFESDTHPDPPFEPFAAGRLGIIKPTWGRSFLYVAYRYLAGPGFNAAEQHALVSYWNGQFGTEPLPAGASDWIANTSINKRTIVRTGEAVTAWLDARSKVPNIGPLEGIGIYRDAPAEYGLFSFINCNEDAFHAAAATLGAMIAKFGISSTQVKDWVMAQDQVFDNCSDRVSDFGSNEGAWLEMVDEWNKARDKVGGVGPTGAYSNSCRGIRFRIAANHLNVMIGKLGAGDASVKEWVEAEDKTLADCSQPKEPSFDSPSPPSPDIPEPLTSGAPFERAQRNYQIAAANFYCGSYDTAAQMFAAIGDDPASPWRSLAPYLVARSTIRKATLSANSNDQKLLVQAEVQLKKVIATSNDVAVKDSARRLLGFVDAQLHPEQRQEELTRAVMASTSGGAVFEQNVSDYVWMLAHGHAEDGDDNRPASDDLTTWILNLRGFEQNPPNSELAAPAIQQWKKSSSLPWQVAAIIEAPASDPSASALIAAAEKVGPESPGFATLGYHTSRLLSGQGHVDQARKQLDAILARRDELPLTTMNEFKALRMRIALNLSDFLEYAPRTPLGFTDAQDPDQLPSRQDTPALKALAGVPLFDRDAANVLTRWMPLSMQIDAAHSQILAPRLRGQVAMAAFIKAILLRDDAAARGLSSQVMDAYPVLKPSIEAWLAAKRPDEESFAAALMMLRNPGLRCEVEAGAGRETPLDQIDPFRDNWWSPSNQSSTDQTAPSFLTSAENEAAAAQWNKLSAINVPNYLCAAAIEQTKNHPGDARAPEALYRCITAIHLGCSNSNGTEYAKMAFTMLHARYPKSEWAQKGQFWYQGSDCK